MDDYLGGADYTETAKRRVEKTKILFCKAQLNMQNWATNDKGYVFISKV